MTFSFAPAVRAKVSLVIAIAGTTGSGKTMSAFRIARGISPAGKIFVLDTEAGRALHYAVTEGEEPGEFSFAFMHGDLKPPFTPKAYADAIAAADKSGAEVIIVDSVSHEYDGEGGVLDMATDTIEKKIATARDYAKRGKYEFDEYKYRERMTVSSYNIPKQQHKRVFVNRLLQCRAHLILCCRAEEKIHFKKIKQQDGSDKQIILQAADLPPAQRWTPIVEKRFMYEMTLSLVLTPDNPGVPYPIKLQQQHKRAIDLKRPLDESVGASLAAWASGGTAPQLQAPASPSSSLGECPPRHEGGEVTIEHWDEQLRELAEDGDEDGLRQLWLTLPARAQHELEDAKEDYKKMARQVNEQRQKQDEKEEPPPAYDTTAERAMDREDPIEQMIGDYAADRGGS